MSINSIIIETLTPYVPTAFHSYTGSATTYITFYTQNQYSSLTADDDELETAYVVHMDLYGKGNIETLAPIVKSLLKPYGFRRTSEIEGFNPETKTYQKSLTFSVSISN